MKHIPQNQITIPDADRQENVCVCVLKSVVRRYSIGGSGLSRLQVFTTFAKNAEAKQSNALGKVLQSRGPLLP